MLSWLQSAENQLNNLSKIGSNAEKVKSQICELDVSFKFDNLYIAISKPTYNTVGIEKQYSPAPRTHRVTESQRTNPDTRSARRLFQGCYHRSEASSRREQEVEPTLRRSDHPQGLYRCLGLLAIQ